MVDIHHLKKLMKVAEELANELLPEGVDRPYWNPRKGSGNVPLPTHNAWVEIMACHHLWGSAVCAIKDGNLEDGRWCAEWPEDVYPECVRIIEGRLGEIEGTKPHVRLNISYQPKARASDSSDELRVVTYRLKRGRLVRTKRRK